jgi:hypothetical protein
MKENADTISTWWRKYRIVRDNYNGYEAQKWTIYWPFWGMVGFCNTLPNVEAAERLCRVDAGETVKHL